MSGITVILGKSLLTEGQVKQTEKVSSKEISVVPGLNNSTLPGAAQDKEQVQPVRFLSATKGQRVNNRAPATCQSCCRQALHLLSYQPCQEHGYVSQRKELRPGVLGKHCPGTVRKGLRSATRTRSHNDRGPGTPLLPSPTGWTRPVTHSQACSGHPRDVC